MFISVIKFWCKGVRRDARVTKVQQTYFDILEPSSNNLGKLDCLMRFGKAVLTLCCGACIPVSAEDSVHVATYDQASAYYSVLSQ